MKVRLISSVGGCLAALAVVTVSGVTVSGLQIVASAESGPAAVAASGSPKTGKQSLCLRAKEVHRKFSLLPLAAGPNVGMSALLDGGKFRKEWEENRPTDSQTDAAFLAAGDELAGALADFDTRAVKTPTGSLGTPLNEPLRSKVVSSSQSLLKTCAGLK